MRARALAHALFCSLLVAAMGSPSIAYAGEPDSAAIKDARKRFAEGVKRYERGDYEGARVAWIQAQSILKLPALETNLATAELHTGHPADAARRFRAYLADPRRPIAIPDERFRELLAKAESLSSRARLVGLPPSAIVLLDGTQLSDDPHPTVVDMMPGEHDIEVRDRDESRPFHVSLAAGEETTLHVEPHASSATSQVPAVTTVPPTAETANRPSGKALPLDTTPANRRVGRKPYAELALFGAGVASAGLGVWFLTQRASESNKLAEMQSTLTRSSCYGAITSPCLEAQDAASAKATNGTWATVSFVAAGAFVGLGSAVWYWNARRAADDPPAAHLTIVPALAPGVAGASASGSF